MDTDFDPSILHNAFDFRPGPGESVSILPGIRWLRMPLPFSLAHINLWLLEDGDGWAIVDTGIASNKTRELWRRVFEEDMQGKPVSRVVVTHLHPDHSGCAGWLVEECGVDLWMSREEYLLCRLLTADTGQAAPVEGTRFYRAAGFTDKALSHYVEMFGLFGRFVSSLPKAYHRLQDDMTFRIGEHRWEVIVGRGHSPEHACLYCAELNVLISGDQVLPTISSNVSVYPTEPAADPLADWLDSLRHLKARLPADVLVLPSHGRPFRGIQPRLDALIDDHLEGLDRLREMCTEPRRAIDVFPALFKSEIDERNLVMATGESLAHLNYLLALGELSVDRDEAGVDWYVVA